MIKPIFRIDYNKLDICGFLLIIPVSIKKTINLFKIIENNYKLPDDVNKNIISYFPDHLNVYIRVDIPNTFPVNPLYVSFYKIENKFLFPNFDFNDFSEYLKFKANKFNFKFCEVDNRSNIDFDYLKKKSTGYMKNQIDFIYNLFKDLQFIHY